MYTDYFHSPFGILEIRANQKQIYEIRIVSSPNKEICPNAVTQITLDILKRYFDGKNPPIDFSLFYLQGTLFQKSVWTELQQIPYGTTVNYAQIVQRIGNPRAVRAVGTAIGRNPICILIPCHRVIPTTGGIGNYAYGTTIKKRLLLLEQQGID